MIKIILIIAVLFFVTKQSTSLNTLDYLFKKYGDQYKIDPMLLKAIAFVESSLNPSIKNPDDPSYGLMQIYCTPDGHGGCSNKFNIEGWPPKSSEELLNPDYNLYLASQILTWNLKSYGFPKGIAVYNSWSARNDPDKGPFKNQGYVDKVLAKYKEYGGAV